MRHPARNRVYALAIVLLTSPAIALGQTGRLTGRITDRTGAALPGITLEISGPELRAPRTVVTDQSGRFNVAGLPTGRFSVTCNAPGFVQWHREGIEVGPGGPAILNVVMRRPGELQVASRAAPPPHRGNESAAAPPPPPADRPTPHQLLEQIDRYLQQLDPGSVAFNAPENMLVGETTEMRLLLSPKLSVEALERELRDMPGLIQGATVKIAPRMEAVLAGQSFAVTPITPALQAVTLNEPTEWRWQVTPKSAGAQRLHLVLNATIEGTSRTLKTFDRTIQVNVTWGQQFSGFTRENWKWLWTTALVPLVGWLWRRRSGQRPAPAASRRG